MNTSRGASTKSSLLVLAVGGLFLFGIVAHVPGINGPSYWQWSWRNYDFGRGLSLFAGPLAVYGYLLRRWQRGAAEALPPATVRALLVGLVACTTSFTLAGLCTLPQYGKFIGRIVHNRYATGYFTDAEKIGALSDFLAQYPLLERAPHSITHPPGPVVFWWLCIRLAGNRLAPFFGAALLALGVGLGVALLYHFARLWTAEPHRRLAACFLYALTPGPLLWLPELDQVYPLLSMGLLVCWSAALRGQWSRAVLLGCGLFVSSMMAYNLLTVGLPMVLYALMLLVRARFARSELLRFVTASAIALVTASGAYLVLWRVTGFDPVSSLRQALASMEQVAAELNRSYVKCVFFDIYDFFLASGMMTLPLVWQKLGRSGSSAALRHERWMTLVGVLTVLGIDVTGLLRCETARVWLFLQPFVVVPAALQWLELDPFARSLCLALQALIVVAIKCNLGFFS